MPSARVSNFARRAGSIVMAGMLVAGVVIALRGPQGLSTLFEKRKEIQQLQLDNANLQKDIDEAAERIRKLKEDPNFQQEIVRRDLNRVRPNETTLMYPAAPKN